MVSDKGCGVSQAAPDSRLPDYSFDSFEEFSKARTELIVAALKAMNESWQATWK